MPSLFIHRCLPLLLAAVYAAPARALPSMADYWRLTCGIKKLRSPLDSACAAYVAEKKRFDAATLKFQEAGGKGTPPVENHAASLAQVKAMTAALDAKAKQNKNDGSAVDDEDDS